jgi:hypothetical protein
MTGDSVDIFDPPQHLIGSLELRYSYHCGTSWGRFAPTPALTVQPPVTLTFTAKRPADGAISSYSVTYDGQAAFGNMLISRYQCVYVELVFHRGVNTSPVYGSQCRKAGP